MSIGIDGAGNVVLQYGPLSYRYQRTTVRTIQLSIDTLMVFIG